MTGPRLSIIPARAATDPALKPRDLQVLCVLGRHTDDLGWCTKSQVKMAGEMGCARSTVFEAIERLMAAGYLERHVVEQSNGRDAPHLYRIILDPVHPSLSSLRPEPEEGDSEGSDLADQSAPPAGISAPPAGPGPAPKNDPLRTNLRERARDEDEKKIEAEGWALLKNWPGFDGMPKEPAMKIWRTLDAEERATARRRFLPWLTLLKAQRKSHVPAPSTYLTEKLWQAVADPADAPPAPVLAAPFGKAWGARRMAVLLAGSGPLPPPKGFSAKLIEEGGKLGQREELSRQATYGYPEVSRMHQLAADAKGWTLRPEIEPGEAVLALMAQCRVGSDEYWAWKALHDERGWPWLPDPGRQEWVYFPAGGPDGLKAFELAVRGGKDDAGGREAAE
ncbi:helix-turn-helix domain-containing protein [Mesorhizobium sp. YC-39]|uniref:helix-turn-helix domain-containing protein n=1 Tax=unclassified Mesorhizobium TaxID=325217 RepID=UPI0021E7534E|nr:MULTISPECIES: helix-turn-helix domain-containing protein [unclassified Mesorhizobium]MCV3209618.1 helix-turn-helix domain-containing protein [Mesorhizobium sp. YC-2]MCV3230148.1 helix-turn-helix domain-containing protein [Mesorhizobium sp. YC-39]